MSRLHDRKAEANREKGVIERAKDWLLAPAKPRKTEKVKPLTIKEIQELQKARK